VSSAHSDQATYYRTALLLGLVDGITVHDWAHRVIERDAKVPTAFFELISIDPADLSAQRHALWPLVIEPDPPAVLRLILARVGADLQDGHRSLEDTIIVLRQMRSLLRLPPDLYEGLNAAVVAHASEGHAAHAGEGHNDAIGRWLRGFVASSDEPVSRDSHD
jgi:hypothetical protein